MHPAGLTAAERRRAVTVCCTKLDAMEQADPHMNARKWTLLRNQVRMLLDRDLCSPHTDEGLIDVFVQWHREMPSHDVSLQRGEALLSCN